MAMPFTGPPLASALGISLLAHLALFWLWDMPSMTPSSTTLTVTLAPTEVSGSASKPEAETFAAPPPPLLPPPLPEPRRKEIAVPEQKKQATIIRQQPEAMSEKMTIPQEMPAQTAFLADPPLELTGTAKPDGSHDETGGEAASTNADSSNTKEAPNVEMKNHGQRIEDAIREYRDALRRNIQEVSRHYPAQNNAVGRASMARVKLAWRLGIAQINLQQSSGMPRLDETAQAIMREAAARTPLPPALQHHSFDTVLPVEYRRN